MTHAAQKDQARFLLDAITPEQLRAVVGLLEVMVDPMAHKLASAPIEDELMSDRERASAAAADGPWIPMEEVMAELGISQLDLNLQRNQDEASEATQDACLNVSSSTPA